MALHGEEKRESEVHQASKMTLRRLSYYLSWDVAISSVAILGVCHEDDDDDDDDNDVDFFYVMMTIMMVIDVDNGDNACDNKADDDVL